MFKTMIVAATVITSLAAAANAASTGYVSNPSSNSVDWTTAVLGDGLTINNNLDFDGMSTGALNGSFYAGTDGVTLSTTGSFNSVSFGAGPGQGNTTGAIPGEGTHAASNFLLFGTNPSSLIVTFDQDVFGAGIFTLDAWSGFGTSTALSFAIEGFTGANGTGTSVGSYASVDQNFQNNNLYFMGLTTDTAMRSFVFTDLTNNGGDTFGLDNLVFATGDVAPVPLPAGLPLLAAALGSFGLARRLF